MSVLWRNGSFQRDAGVRGPTASLRGPDFQREDFLNESKADKEFICHKMEILLAKLENYERGEKMYWWEDAKELQFREWNLCNAA